MRQVIHRKCLKCSLLFNSQGVHNRVCDHCRQENTVNVAAQEDIGGLNRLSNAYQQDAAIHANTERFRSLPKGK